MKHAYRRLLPRGILPAGLLGRNTGGTVIERYLHITDIWLHADRARISRPLELCAPKQNITVAPVLGLRQALCQDATWHEVCPEVLHKDDASVLEQVAVVVADIHVPGPAVEPARIHELDFDVQIGQ